MGSANRTLALLTSSEFKWTAEIQYMGTLANRDEAIRFATQNGCNLIVKYEKRMGPQFDVMIDPAPSWTTSSTCGAAKGPAQPKSTGARKLSFLGMFGLGRRVSSATASAAQG